MHIIAMAGLAEAAFAQGLMMLGALLVVVAILSAVAFWRRAPVVAFVAFFLCLAVGILFEPWRSFSPASYPADPDEIYWLTRYRIAAVVWLLCFLATIGCWTFAVRRKKIQLDAQVDAS